MVVVVGEIYWWTGGGYVVVLAQFLSSITGCPSHEKHFHCPWKLCFLVKSWPDPGICERGWGFLQHTGGLKVLRKSVKIVKIKCNMIWLFSSGVICSIVLKNPINPFKPVIIYTQELWFWDPLEKNTKFFNYFATVMELCPMNHLLELPKQVQVTRGNVRWVGHVREKMNPFCRKETLGNCGSVGSCTIPVQLHSTESNFWTGFCAFPSLVLEWAFQWHNPCRMTFLQEQQSQTQILWRTRTRQPSSFPSFVQASRADLLLLWSLPHFAACGVVVRNPGLIWCQNILQPQTYTTLRQVPCTPQRVCASDSSERGVRHTFQREKLQSEDVLQDVKDCWLGTLKSVWDVAPRWARKLIKDFCHTPRQLLVAWPPRPRFVTQVWPFLSVLIAPPVDRGHPRCLVPIYSHHICVGICSSPAQLPIKPDNAPLEFRGKWSFFCRHNQKPHFSLNCCCEYVLICWVISCVPVKFQKDNWKFFMKFTRGENLNSQDFQTTL